MRIGRLLRRKAKAVVAPVVFLLLVGYFLWQATQGDRGLTAYAQRREELRAANLELVRAEAELAGWERRVAGLRPTRLDGDALDERARALLNLSDPDDIVVPYGNNGRLF